VRTKVLSRLSSILPVVILSSLATSSALAQGLPESDWGEPWNSVGIGVRAMGMGSAFTAISDDASGAYWNPGGLVRMKDTQFTVMSGSPYIMRIPKDNGVGDWFTDYRNTMKQVGSIGFVTTKWKPWAAGWTMVRSFHPESLNPWQETYQQGTFTLPLNTARTAGLGLNVKLLSSDIEYERATPPASYPIDDTFSFVNESDRKVNGWAMDVGGVYVIPMPVRDRYRQVNFGLMARNLIGRKTIGNTETEIPRMAQMGVAFMFDDLLPRERSVVSLDLHQGLLSSLGANSQQIRMGFEQWFFKNLGALRVGYAAPFPAYNTQLLTGGYLFQGYKSYTFGATLNLANLQFDLAVTTPDLFGTQKLKRFTQEEIDSETYLDGIPETPVIPQGTDYLPIEPTRMYLQVTYHWRSPVAPPFVRVNVEPLVFSPKKGEVAVFNLDYRDDLGIDSWALEIRNSSKVAVRTFSGKGSPPARLVWDGLDDRFNLAQDDDHTYSLRIRNREGVETVTSPQAFRVFTPEDSVKGDPTLIYRLLEEQARRDADNKAKMNESINKKLDEGKAPVDGGAAPK
jgi:hypothetical protein